MGPPKYKPPRLSHVEKLKRYDYFEYRYNKDDRSYYMFNPYTGETIYGIHYSIILTTWSDLLQDLIHLFSFNFQGTDTNYLDRSKSMWAPKDEHVSESAQITILYPQF